MEHAEQSAAGASAPIPLPLTPVVGSSNIAAAGYSADVKLLDLKFVSGAVHRYSGVPPEVFDGFLASKSKGTFFGKEIRGRFQSQRIDLPTPTQQAPASAPTKLSPNSAWPFPSR